MLSICMKTCTDFLWFLCAFFMWYVWMPALIFLWFLCAFLCGCWFRAVMHWICVNISVLFCCLFSSSVCALSWRHCALGGCFVPSYMKNTCGFSRIWLYVCRLWFYDWMTLRHGFDWWCVLYGFYIHRAHMCFAIHVYMCFVIHVYMCFFIDVYMCFVIHVYMCFFIDVYMCFVIHVYVCFLHEYVCDSLSLNDVASAI